MAKIIAPAIGVLISLFFSKKKLNDVKKTKYKSAKRIEYNMGLISFNRMYYFLLFSL